jgi:hypothetical protein
MMPFFLHLFGIYQRSLAFISGLNNDFNLRTSFRAEPVNDDEHYLPKSQGVR